VVGLLITEKERFIVESVSEKKILIGKYLAMLQARTWLSHALCVPGQCTANRQRNLGIFNNDFTANLPRKLSVKSLKIS